MTALIDQTWFRCDTSGLLGFWDVEAVPRSHRVSCSSATSWPRCLGYMSVLPPDEKDAVVAAVLLGGYEALAVVMGRLRVLATTAVEDAD